MFNSQSLL